MIYLHLREDDFDQFESEIEGIQSAAPRLRELLDQAVCEIKERTSEEGAE